jgi:hypothetical protein
MWVIIKQYAWIFKEINIKEERIRFLLLGIPSTLKLNGYSKALFHSSFQNNLFCHEMSKMWKLFMK